MVASTTFHTHRGLPSHDCLIPHVPLVTRSRQGIHPFRRLQPEREIQPWVRRGRDREGIGLSQVIGDLPKGKTQNTGPGQVQQY